jgi:hypothetical protein
MARDIRRTITTRAREAVTNRCHETANEDFRLEKGIAGVVLIFKV